MKNCLYSFFICVVILFACDRNDAESNLANDNDIETDVNLFNEKRSISGKLVLKLRKELPIAPVITRTADGRTEINTGIESLDAYIRNIGGKKLTRVFPPAGKFEVRSRKAGLHLWYTLEFDKEKSLTRVAQDLYHSDDIVLIEPVYEVVSTFSGKFRKYEMDNLENRNINAFAETGFNDPILPDQWNYNNDGSVVRSIAGADIRLFGAWKKNTGNSEVIVAVVDGGIDHTHVDLAANMWINEAEKNGQEGVDDDGNGYIDDIYGYNFVEEKPLEADLHGTHVAGTIAAVNNNGIGVAGIAGGDGTSGSGVRLMSCQILVDNERGKGGASTDNIAAALKYAADNGAVISQNSWGYEDNLKTPTYVLNAIKYFIDYAGIDENGKQTGPMKGGILFFAAGNDHNSVNAYPASEENVISVAAMAPNYKKAVYSNYGPTVNIFAPGGDMSYDLSRATTSIVSTAAGWNGYTMEKNSYYYMDGTSMACPHVSGVAALIVSHFGVGKPGFTPRLLRKILFGSLYDVYKYNPDFIGQLGVGVPDATVALENSKIHDPDIGDDILWEDLMN